MKTIAAVASIALLTSASAFAFNAQDQRVDRQQTQQKQKINQGVQSGQITAEEKARLQSRSRNIDNTQQRTPRDGNVSQQEQQRINKAVKNQGGSNAN